MSCSYSNHFQLPEYNCREELKRCSLQSTNMRNIERIKKLSNFQKHKQTHWILNCILKYCFWFAVLKKYLALYFQLTFPGRFTVNLNPFYLEKRLWLSITKTETNKDKSRSVREMKSRGGAPLLPSG